MGASLLAGLAACGGMLVAARTCRGGVVIHRLGARASSRRRHRAATTAAWRWRVGPARVATSRIAASVLLPLVGAAAAFAALPARVDVAHPL